MPAILKVSGTRKTVCLLVFVDSILIHACLSVCDCHCHCEEGCYIIMVSHWILYIHEPCCWLYVSWHVNTPVVVTSAKKQSNTPWLIEDCFILTSQVMSIDWSTLLVDGSTARRTIGLLHKYGFMCSCPPMRRTVNWLQYVKTLSPTPLPDSINLVHLSV